MGPATFVVLFFVVMMIIAGVLIMRAKSMNPSGGERCPTQDCGHPNEPGAQFCARCGQQLPDAE